MKIPSIRLIKSDGRRARDRAEPTGWSTNTRRIIRASNRPVRATAARARDIAVERSWRRETRNALSRFLYRGSARIEPAIPMRMTAPASALSRKAARRRSTRMRKTGELAGRASKIGRRRPTHSSAQVTKCPVSNNVGDDSRQISRHSTHYVIRGEERLCGPRYDSPRNKYYIYLQLQKRPKIRLELACATQYYIFTINTPPVNLREFPCWSAADLAMCVRELQTGHSSCLDPDRSSPTPRIEST
jgi:hypothetical protein